MQKQDDGTGAEWAEIARELLMGLQFHDRNLVACFGLSVSQCHALLLIGSAGPLTMGALARRLYLSASTMTRIVDRLRRKRLVLRVPRADDRRHAAVALTAQGRSRYRQVDACVRSSRDRVLEQVPAQDRPRMLAMLRDIVAALRGWHTECCRTGRPPVAAPVAAGERGEDEGVECCDG